MTADYSAERKTGWILAGIAAAEATGLAFMFIANGSAFVRYLGFSSGGTGSVEGWILALIVVAAFVGASTRLPSVRANLVRPSELKVLGLAVAVFAGILEEVVFRKWIMDDAARRGAGVLLQIAVSGAAFGFVHSIWGLLGRSVRAALGATLSTAALGAGLACVYVSGRSLAPCIAAHFLINALIEPGLVLAAAHGEMGRSRGAREMKRT